MKSAPCQGVLVQKVGQCRVIRFRDRFEEVFLQKETLPV